MNLPSLELRFRFYHFLKMKMRSREVYVYLNVCPSSVSSMGLSRSSPGLRGFLHAPGARDGRLGERIGFGFKQEWVSV